MVGNVQHPRSRRCLVNLDAKGMLALVDDEIDIVCLGEGYHFHVVPISPPFGHPAQVTLEGCIEFGGRGCLIVKLGCECARVLSLWVSSSATARVGLDETLVVVSVGSHVLYSCITNSSMLGLISVELVGKGMEETVA